ncbi:MAG: hypothetical protein MJY96_00410 [Bacteroidaceae bacterium]|nr:hypothetical protein [Bacteroidaceae bacterium]
MKFSNLVFVAVPLAAAIIYRCKKDWLFGFCRAMCLLPSARQLFVRVLVLVELVFHFLFMSSGCAGVGMAVSTALLLLFVLRQRKRDLMTMFRGSPKRLFCLFAVCLASAFVPFLFPVTMSLGLFICAVCFWPSPGAIYLWLFPLSADYFNTHKSQCVECYFHRTGRQSQYVSEILNTF